MRILLPFVLAASAPLSSSLDRQDRRTLHYAVSTAQSNGGMRLALTNHGVMDTENAVAYLTNVKQFQRLTVFTRQRDMIPDAAQFRSDIEDDFISQILGDKAVEQRIATGDKGSCVSLLFDSLQSLSRRRDAAPRRCCYQAPQRTNAASDFIQPPNKDRKINCSIVS